MIKEKTRTEVRTDDSRTWVRPEEGRKDDKIPVRSLKAKKKGKVIIQMKEITDRCYIKRSSRKHSITETKSRKLSFFTELDTCPLARQ